MRGVRRALQQGCLNNNILLPFSWYFGVGISTTVKKYYLVPQFLYRVSCHPLNLSGVLGGIIYEMKTTYSFIYEIVIVGISGTDNNTAGDINYQRRNKRDSGKRSSMHVTR